MSIIRVLQESRAMKDSAIFSLSPNDYEMENMKQLIKEKDVILQNNKERIEELENHVAELTEHCASLQKTDIIPKLNIEDKELEDKELEDKEIEEQLNKLKEYSEMPNIVRNYELFINEITANYETVKEERNTAGAHLCNLEYSFADLINKYERLKTIVTGYQENQETLLNHIDVYKNAVNLLHERYDIFKKYATDKLNEAMEHIGKRDQKHTRDLQKVKSKIFQSKIKISELEKKLAILTTNISVGDATPEVIQKSAFTPLSTDIHEYI